MATPGQLVETVATALGLPQPTVVLYDRILAENGLRSKGGRGRSAAKVTALDAANLLIAIAGAPASGPSVNSAIETVECFARLMHEPLPDLRNIPAAQGMPDEMKELLSTPDFFEMPGFEALPQRHSFREGLIALIETVRSRSLTFPRQEGSQPPPNAYVSVEGPFAKATISVRAPGISMAAVARYEARDRKIAWSDLSWRRTFSHRTIGLIAKVLAGEGDASKSRKAS